MIDFVISVIAAINNVWGGGLEAVTGTIALIAVIPTIWWWLLPRYTAVCCHDGSQWIDAPGVWSAARGVAGDDLEPFTKQWLGQLFGKYVNPDMARVPVNPIPRRHHIEWWGPSRGVYYVVGVRILDETLLEQLEGRLDHAPTRFEEEDEYLPL